MKLQKLSLILIALFACLNASAQKADEGWNITSQSQEHYNGVTLANGTIGLVGGADLFDVSEIVLNGVYDKEYVGGVSRIVRAPLFTNLSVKIDGNEVDGQNTTGWAQTLDLKGASLTTSVTHSSAEISYTLRALRHLPYMMLGEVNITPQQDIDIELINSTIYPDELNHCNTHFKCMRDGEHRMPVNVSQAVTRTGMHQLATCTSFVIDGEHMDEEDVKQKGADGMSLKRRLKAGKSYRFALLGAVCNSHQFYDAKNEAERMVVFALQQTIDQLIEQHNQAWQELWQGDIVIEGAPDDQLDVRLALYHLYSFQRKGSRLSISPMGLSTSTGYNGHVFWDSEFWMFPPMLVLNPDLARAHIDYRTDRLQAARRRAAHYGFEGAMYPWESDNSGEEATPTWCLTGPLEHHITADIAIAFWNYYSVTSDEEWLRNEGYPVMRAAADFWVSRASRNDDGSYSIRNVVGANEYAPNVDDNAFTNGSAQTALLKAVAAARILGVKPDSRWTEVAENIRFHYMPDGTMKEHADYEGAMIKQADVNLLAYPLSVVTDRKAILRDLRYYEHKIDTVNGPAMGYSILSVLCSKMGDAAEAYRFFKKGYMPNRRPPFGVLSESPSSDNPYFATGAGGLLQAVVFGFGGIEFSDKGIIIGQGILPDAWKSLTIKGIGPQRAVHKITNKKSNNP